MDDSEEAASYWPPSDLIPWGRNPRKNDHAVATVAGLIERFGWGAPIIAWQRGDPVVIAGHTRLKAAIELELNCVPVRFMPHLSLEEAHAMALADNKSGELADWDEEQLGQILADLAELDVSLEWLGFDPKELDELIAVATGEGGVDDPGPSEPPADPGSERGTVYELGPHRLMCGDSTSAEDVATLLGGEKPNMMVTDPPYGVEYDAGWRDNALGEADRRVGVVENDDRADWSEAWALFPGAVVYVWHAGCKSPEVAGSLSWFELRGLICWAKPRFAISRGHYHHQHEPCWYAVRKGKTASWCGDRSQTTLWAIPLDKNLEGDVKHSTQKPLECMERPIRNHEGDVYDPFLGSGTTLIAAARQGRRCHGMEISPAYCDVIRKRWGDYARSNDLDPGPGAL